MVLSIITPTKNDVDALELTLTSIRNCSFSYAYEVIIVDGGDMEKTNTILHKVFGNTEIVHHVKENGKGVFNAQNYGISLAKGEWVIVMNAADIFSEQAEQLLNLQNLQQFEAYDVVVFSQQCYFKAIGDGNVFTPTAYSIWPHQSILVKNKVYKQYGGYNEKYKYSAEQFYFASIRQNVKYIILKDVLSHYEMSGMSTSVNLTHSKEIYALNLALNNGKIKAFQKAYINPYAKKILHTVFSDATINKLKKQLFDYYK